MTSVRDYIDYFKNLEREYGSDCFQAPEKLRKLKNVLLAHIRGHNCYRKVIKTIIRAACEFYVERYNEVRKNRFAGNSPTSTTVITNVVGALVIAAHLCQKFQISDDPLLVTDVLLYIFREDGGFDRIFCFMDPLIFPYEVDPILFPVSHDYYVIEDYTGLLSVAEYFLRTTAHLLMVKSTYSEVDFTLNNAPPRTYSMRIPMVDAPLMTCRGSTPLLLACHSINPSAILLLLRYGANPLRRGQAHQLIGLQFQHPLYVIVSKLNACLFWSTRQPLMDPVLMRQFEETQRSQTDDLERCLRYFCRALPKLPIAFRNDASPTQEETGTNPGKFYLAPEYKFLLPLDRYREPASLTHLCRCLIRNEMLNSRTLPRGLPSLEIPKHLIQYLDLLYD